MRRSDITKGFISPENTHTLLLTLFPDTIILKQDLTIVATGYQVAKMLEIKRKDLRGQSIECLAYKISLTGLLGKELVSGFFDYVDVLLKGEESIMDCSISGFYLGLVSDLNGLIMLRVKFRNQVSHLQSQLEKSRNELDEFVYRTAHDLQGPLATVRGLVNLMKLEHAGGEMAKLVCMIDAQTQKLNDRLHNLHYLSEFAFSGISDSSLDCEVLESKLRSTVEENIPIDSVDFQFITDKRFFKRVNAQLVISMINHLVLYLTNLPINSAPDLMIRVTDKKNMAIGISILSDGFLSDYQLREAVRQKTALYTNIVAYSRLINFFAAQKAAERVSATIKVDFINETRQQISITVPNGK